MPSTTNMQQQRGPGRPREFDEAAVLNDAILVFREKGYHGTSLADLLRATGLTTGSIYKAYKDKAGLFVHALERYITQRNLVLLERISDSANGRDGVREILIFYAESSRSIEGARGCLVVIAAAELSLFDEMIAQRVSGALRLLCGRISTQIDRGKADGSIPQGLDTDATAKLLLCVIQGMRVVGKTERGLSEMDDVVARAMSLIS